MSLIENKSLLAQVRKIKIFSKRLVASSLVGDYVSAFKGVGFEFDQLREYHHGDDIRFISWNASAKSSTLMLKEFVPERDRAVILAIDCSSSMGFSSSPQLKSDVAQQLSAALAFIANLSNDRVGMLAFAQGANTWMPPQKGPLIVTKILDNLCLAMNKGGKTNLAEGLGFLLDRKLSSSVIFIISDWIDESSINFKELKLLAKKHDVIAVRILDSHEKLLPKVGCLNLKDPETGEEITVNVDAKLVENLLTIRLKEQQQNLESCGIDLLDITVNDRLDRSLAKFFHKRTRRH